MIDASPVYSKALPQKSERVFRLQMRPVGHIPPLSMMGGYVASGVAYVVLRLALAAPPWQIEERILAWNWGGMVLPWFAITVLPFLLWIRGAQHFLILHKNGTSAIAKKNWWQRLSDRHLIFELGTARTAEIELLDGDSWWQPPTTTIGDVHYALFLQKSAVKRFRTMLANPSAPPPPLY